MNSKQVFSTYFKEYNLSDKDLKQLHSVLYSMLKDLKFVCEKYNIKYMLSGGSVLGAVRHNDFIPWDDDIDIMMYRADYNKINNLFIKEFADKYTIKSFDNDESFVFKNKKIFLNKTKYVEIEAENFPCEQNIFIDIFPIDNMPNNKIVRKIRGCVHDFAYLATGAIYYYKFPSTTITNKAKENNEIKKFYLKRRSIGFILNYIFGFKFYMKLQRKLANYKKITKYEGIPTGIRYNREVFEHGFFNDVIMCKFGTEEFPIPKNYDRYLKNLYGNYMVIPPLDKREVHTALEINFGIYGEQ